MYLKFDTLYHKDKDKTYHTLLQELYILTLNGNSISDYPNNKCILCVILYSAFYKTLLSSLTFVQNFEDIDPRNRFI